MTVAAVTPIVTYNENGSTVVFAVPFQFIASADLVVTRIDPAGARTLAVLGSDYTVAGGNFVTGTVTVAVAMASGWTLEIKRVTSRTQPTDYTPNDAFPAETHEHALDRGIMIAQEVAADLTQLSSRSLRAPLGETVDGLPDAANRADMVLCFDEDGDLELRPFGSFPAGPQGNTGLHGSGNLIGFSADDYLTPNSSSAPVVAANTIGIAALVAAVQAANGGVIDFTPGATYYMGGQTFGAPPVSGRFTGYTGIPDVLFEFIGLTGPLTIRGNGAKLEVIARKYGTFSALGVATSHALPYTGPEIASYYDTVIWLDGCSGFFHIENLEIDGNCDDATVGGGWGDTGWQLGGTGIKLTDHSGGYKRINVNSHHHTADGFQISGPATDEDAPHEQGYSENCKDNYNCRLGLAAVGGRGHKFVNCEFNWNANTAATGTTISSNPASGVDFEAEGGKIVCDFSFSECDFIGNLGPQIVADSGPSRRITFDLCRFVQTNPDFYVVWPKKPYIKFSRCLLAGTVVSVHLNALNPAENVAFDDCIFSSSAEHSPTGTLGMINNLLFDIPVGVGLVVRRALLDFNRAGVSVNASVDEIRFEDPTIVARAGSPGVSGRLSGKIELIEAGGTITAIPGGVAILSKTNAGHAEDSWGFTTGGVRTVYPATWSREHNKPLHHGSATYNPPSLAAGEKTTIQTITVTGVALGDKVVEVSFSQDLAGARVSAWVSAADTVSYYFVNENGADPLDLASGTVRVKVVGA